MFMFILSVFIRHVLVSFLVLCTSHGCCVKVTDIAAYIPLCHPPFYESVKRCNLSCIAQSQRPQAAPVLPLALSQPVHSPRKRELAQLVRSLHQCADLVTWLETWCCVHACITACVSVLVSYACVSVIPHVQQWLPSSGGGMWQQCGHKER